MRRINWGSVASTSAFVVLLVAIVVLAALRVTGTVKSADTSSAIPLVIVAVVMVLLGPGGVSQLIARLRKVTLPSLGSYEFAGTAARDPEKARGLVDVRLLIQAQLAYLAKHALADERGPTYLTVGSLRHDRLIDDRQAALIDRVMTVSESEFSEMPESDALLKEARRLSGDLIFTVFFRYVWCQLGERFTVSTVTVEDEPFDDLNVTNGARSFRIHPVAFRQRVDPTRARLAGVADSATTPAVVVPWEEAVAHQHKGGVRVMNLAQLIAEFT